MYRFMSRDNSLLIPRDPERHRREDPNTTSLQRQVFRIDIRIRSASKPRDIGSRDVPIRTG
jgi:hypothetical protein